MEKNRIDGFSKQKHILQEYSCAAVALLQLESIFNCFKIYIFLYVKKQSCCSFLRKKIQVQIPFIQQYFRFMNPRQLQSIFLSKDARMKFKLLSLAVGFVLTGGAAQYATPISKISPRSFLLLLNMKLKVNTQHPKIICDIPVQIT